MDIEYARISARIRGLTLIELLVVIGIIALLLSLLLPVLSRSRASARAIACASQLREMGRAMQLYASDNGGFVPRDHTPWRPDRRPYWMVQAGAYLKDTEDWESARTNFPLSERLLQETELFHCPEHPLAGEVPGTYVINAFRFESKPDWNPDGPVKLAQIREGGDVVWIGEAADQMRGASILLPEFHDAFHPEDLPGGSRERLTDSRHNNATNILFFDSSVRRIARGKLTLPMFDDGIRQRSTPSVFAGP